MSNPIEFRKDIETAINRASMENGSNTPDFILAEYLTGCLEVFDRALQHREKWFGRAVPGHTNALPPVDPLIEEPE